MDEPASRAPFDPTTPASWGPEYWSFAHAVAAAYPLAPSIQDIETARIFFTRIFPGLLPCSTCSSSWTNDILRKAVPLTRADLSSRQKLSRWVWNVHNAVNAKTGSSAVEWDTLLARYPSIMAQRTPVPGTRRLDADTIDVVGGSVPFHARRTTSRVAARPVSTVGAARVAAPAAAPRAPAGRSGVKIAATTTAARVSTGNVGGREAARNHAGNGGGGVRSGCGCNKK